MSERHRPIGAFIYSMISISVVALHAIAIGWGLTYGAPAVKAWYVFFFALNLLPMFLFARLAMDGMRMNGRSVRSSTAVVGVPAGVLLYVGILHIFGDSSIAGYSLELRLLLFMAIGYFLFGVAGAIYFRRLKSQGMLE